jgi:charged multivesicular body protein 4A/B
MRLFFGKKKEVPETAAVSDPNAGLPDAIQKNKSAIETLDKREKLLEKRISDEEEEAKRRVANGDKRGALMTLKRKKMLEQELETLMNSRLTLEQQINSLEAAQMSHIAVKALAHGVNVHKQLNKQLDAESVDRLMEDLQDQQDLQNEIAQVLSAGTRIGDDEDLLRELEQMEAKQQDEFLIDASNVPQAKVAATKAPPTTAAPQVVKQDDISAEEEAELAALQQSMS